MLLFRLSLARVYAPDAPGGGDGKAPDTKPDTKPADGKAPDAKPDAKAADDPTAAELAALRKWKADQEAAEAARLAADRKRSEEEAAKRGEYEKLYTAEKERAAKHEAELKELRAREETRQKALGAKNTEALKTLPADLAALAPAGADADTLAAWIERAAKVSGAERPAGAAPRNGVPPKVKLTPEQEAEAARRGLTPEKWAEILTKAGRIKLPATA